MRPNIILIMADQFVWDGIGAVGGWTDTPNLDRIFCEGTSFENCYTTAPLCLPARASLLTGKYPGELGLIDNYCDGLQEQSRTWVQALRESGYRTALIGKLHAYKWTDDLRTKEGLVHALGFTDVCEIPGPRTYGIKKSIYYEYLKEKGLLDIYNRDLDERYARSVYDTKPTPLPAEHYADVFVMDQAVRWLSQQGNEKEWFLQLSFGGPHEPWDTPEEYVKRYEGRTMPLPLKKPADTAVRPEGVYDHLLNGRYDPLLNESIRQMTSEDIDRVRKSYAGHVTLIDDQIGRLMQKLEAMGELDHTLLVFTSDHGEQNGDYGLLFKQTFLNSSARIPLAFWYPAGGMGSRREGRDVELIDVGASIAKFAGVELNYDHHALSILPDGNCEKRRFIVSQLYGETMIMDKRYKAVFNSSGEIYMLFDREEDPREEWNLAGSGRAEEAQVRRLKEYWAQVNG